MTSADVIAATRDYIMDNYLYMRRDAVLQDDEALIEQRIIDSMGVVELVQFLQDTFAVEIDDDEITEEHLGSLTRIARVVMRKGAGVDADADASPMLIGD